MKYVSKSKYKRTTIGNGTNSRPSRNKRKKKKLLRGQGKG